MNFHSFECPECGAVSHHKHDVENLYCGRCHRERFAELTGTELEIRE